MVFSVAFSHDGKLIASGSGDKSICIWDVSSHTAVGEPLMGHDNWVRSVVFSSDGALLASGSDDSTVRIWDMCAQASTSTPGHSPEAAQSIIPSPHAIPFSSTLQQSSVDLNISLYSMQHLQDGWITGLNGELVLWIPPSHRTGLGDSRMLAVLGDPNRKNTILDFENMVCGSDWAKCCTGGSVGRAN